MAVFKSLYETEKVFYLKKKLVVHQSDTLLFSEEPKHILLSF